MPELGEELENIGVALTFLNNAPVGFSTIAKIQTSPARSGQCRRRQPATPRSKALSRRRQYRCGLIVTAAGSETPAAVLRSLRPLPLFSRGA
jgi:hypothetical protein